ncbi:hypothetical protein LDL59_01730 [Kaistella anthropi]|nr:hypothetical protein [Kaistella anthropi]
MDLIKWTKNIKPKFPNVVEKFFGKKIDDQASGSEEIASVPTVNINDKGKTFEVSLAAPGMDKKTLNLKLRTIA